MLSSPYGRHIVPLIKFDRIGGTSSATFTKFKSVAPREICVEIVLIALLQNESSNKYLLLRVAGLSNNL